MPDYVLCFPDRYQDLTKFTVSDETEYEVSAPNRRQDHAQYLVVAKMDEKQALTYIEDIDNSDPLTTLEWLLTSKGDGAYRAFYFIIPLYNNSTSYDSEIVVDEKITQYGDIIYHPGSEKYYIPLVDNVIGIQPSVTSGWETSWEEYDFAANFFSQLDSDKIVVHIHDDIITASYEDCLLSKFMCKTYSELCSLCSNDEAFLTMMKAQFMLDSAISADWQDKAIWAEVILREAKKKYCC